MTDQDFELLAREARAKNPNDISAGIILAELLISRGHYTEAFALFNAGLKSNPKDPRLLISLSRACRDIGEYSTSFALLNAARELEPGNLAVQAMWRSVNRAAALFQNFAHLGKMLASDNTEQAGADGAPFVVDMNGDLLRLPADLLRFIWHTYSAQPAAIVPAFLAETGHYHYVQRAIRAGDTVFDIGSNIGLFTTMMAQAVGPTGRVHAFEPSPTFAADLRRVLGLNELTNVTVNQCAVSDKIGVARFAEVQERDVRRESSHLDMSAGMEQTASMSHRWIEVPTITLDDYVFSHGLEPALLKIDVEGAELLVFKGGQETLRKHHPLIVLEIHPTEPDFFVELHALLTSLDYRWEQDEKIYYCRKI